MSCCTIEVIEVTAPVTVINPDNAISVLDQTETISIVEGGTYSFNFTNAWVFETLSISSLNQTIFQLNNIPLFPHKSLVYLNGQKMTYGVDYVINSSVLNWLFIDLQLNTLDTLEIYFL